MPIQYNEFYNENTGLTVGVKKLLFSEQSEYQLVEVLETDTWGNLLTIDGIVMLSEKDEFVYHEMIIHTAMFAHPAPEKVLIIGGGDGGSAREALRHKTVKQVDLVEIDETVVRASKLFLPEVGAWDDPRLRVLYEDGIAFIKKAKAEYDVIVIDSTDPIDHAVGLFEKEFYELCHAALRENGVLTAQTETPWLEAGHPVIKNVFKSLDSIFSTSAMYLAYIPLYPTGMWSFAFASKNFGYADKEVLDRIDKGLAGFGSELKYYNKNVHQAAFALPNFAADIIR